MVFPKQRITCVVNVGKKNSNRFATFAVKVVDTTQQDVVKGQGFLHSKWRQMFDTDHTLINYYFKTSTHTHKLKLITPNSCSAECVLHYFAMTQVRVRRRTKTNLDLKTCTPLKEALPMTTQHLFGDICPHNYQCPRLLPHCPSFQGYQKPRC